MAPKCTLYLNPSFVTRQLHLTTMILPGLRRLLNPVIREQLATRRYSIAASQFEKLPSDVIGVTKVTSPSVVAVLSYFSGSENREIQYSARRATGFFADSNLIVTSARVVGTVSTVYDSDRRSVVHNCFIARTIAVTGDEKVFCTRPAAVNFAGDVAVLEVLNPSKMAGDLPPPLAVAKAVPDIDRPLLGIVRHENATAFVNVLPGCRRQRGKSIRPKAPWPLDDQLEWIDYGAAVRAHFTRVSLADICGSPWFNFDKEVVGMASWAAEEADGRIISYSAPPIFIKHMVGYASTKGPEDPIVLDRWINKLTIADHTLDVTEECVPEWTRNVIYAGFLG